MTGRKPIGDKPLTKTERQQRWRRRKTIYREESEKYGIVAGSDLRIDQKMLAAFSSIAADIPETSVHDLIFVAMRNFLKETPERQQYAENQGIDDLDKHLFMMSTAEISAFMRIQQLETESLAKSPGDQE